MQVVATLCPAPSTVRGQPMTLSMDASNTKFGYGCNGVAYLRNVERPAKVIAFTNHLGNITCLRVSPSGRLCASGDDKGNLFVWMNRVGTNVVLQQKPLSGAIKDLAWSDDDERLVLVGEGKGTMASAIIVKDGVSIGNITGHQRTITACDFRKKRPYRVCTGAMDSHVNFYEGPPFKFKLGHADLHTSNVNCVKFNPANDLVATVSGSNQIWLFDGLSQEKLRSIATEHTGTIYSIAWFPAGNAVATASADKSVHAYNVSTGEQMMKLPFGTTLDAMQMAVTFSTAGLITFSLSGDVNFIDPDRGVVSSVWRGHKNRVVALGFDSASGRVISVSNEGKVLSTPIDLLSHKAEPFTNTKADIVTSVSFCQDSSSFFAAGGTPDVHQFSVQAKTQSAQHHATNEKGSAAQVLGVAALSSDTVVVLHKSSLSVVKNGNKVAELAGFAAPGGARFDPSALAAHGASSLIAVGGDSAVLVYEYAGGNITLKTTFTGQHRAAVTALCFNHRGTAIASGDNTKYIYVWDPQTGSILFEDLVFHASRITAIAFSDGDEWMASASVDSSIILWDLPQATRIIQQNAHHGGVSAVCFAGDSLLSGGADCCVRRWVWGSAVQQDDSKDGV